MECRAEQGVDCTYTHLIQVQQGFYRPENFDPWTSLTGDTSANRSTEPVLAVPCPWGTKACLGSQFELDETGDEIGLGFHGNASCAVGHFGPFCASCDSPTYYRGSSSCRLCPTDTSHAFAVTAGLIFFGLLVLVMMAFYLKTASVTATGAHPFPLASCFPKMAAAIARLPPSTYRQMSAIVKIGLGLGQCLSTLRSFGRVRWPETFVNMMEEMDRFAVEAFSVVPAECAAGRRLGFVYELIATLLLPVLSFVIIQLLALLVYGLELRQHRKMLRKELLVQAAERGASELPETAGLKPISRRNSFTLASSAKSRMKHQHHENDIRKMLNRPHVWTLHIWAWLLLFPSVTRKVLATFDCIELNGTFYLRSDAAVTCSGAGYSAVAVLAAVGVVVTCFAAPIGLVMVTSRNHKSSERVKRARVALLTNTYQDEFHYWEAVDLTRKLLLTSVVLLVGTDTLLQLWFATATGLFFLVLYLGLSPYRDVAAGRVQLAALVQLEFTYVTAALFFDRESSESQGIGLVVANTVVALLLLVMALQSIGRVGVELRELQLLFVDDGSIVDLPPLNHEYETHLYLSHAWKHAQDQAGTLKSLLYTCMPTCKIFLDVDDVADAEEAEEQVDQASVFLVFLTTEYVGTPKCLHELTTAWRLGKPLLVLRETDPRYGGLSAAAMRAEIELFISRKGKLLPDDELQAIAWLQEHMGKLEWFHREKPLKNAALRSVAEAIYHHTSSGAVDKRSTILGNLTKMSVSLGEKMTPRSKLASTRRTKEEEEEPVASPKAAAGLEDLENAALQVAQTQEERELDALVGLGAGRASLGAVPEGSTQEEGIFRTFSVFTPRGSMSSSRNTDVEDAPTRCRKPSVFASIVGIFDGGAKSPRDGEKRGDDKLAVSPEERPVRRMVLREEIQLTEEDTKDTVIYLSEHYRELAPTSTKLLHDDKNVGGHSMYEELVQQFDKQGVRLTSDSDEAFKEDSRALMLLVLSPGFFACSALVEEAVQAMKHLQIASSTATSGRPTLGALTGRGRFGSRKHLLAPPTGARANLAVNTCMAAPAAAASSTEADSSESAVDGEVAQTRQRGAGLLKGGWRAAGRATAATGALGRLTRRGSSTTEIDEQQSSGTCGALDLHMTSGRIFNKKPKAMVPLHSTAMSYQEYVRTCPPDLKDLGVFDLQSDTWPECEVLQAVAVKTAIRKLPGHHHSKRYDRAAALLHLGRRSHLVTIGEGTAARTTGLGFTRPRMCSRNSSTRASASKSNPRNSTPAAVAPPLLPAPSSDLSMRTLSRKRSTSDSMDVTVSLVKTPLGLGLSVDQNNVVTAVEMDSQAARTGKIAPNDVMISVNAVELSSSVTFGTEFAKLDVGSSLEVVVRRAPRPGLKCQCSAPRSLGEVSRPPRRPKNPEQRKTSLGAVTSLVASAPEAAGSSSSSSNTLGPPTRLPEDEEPVPPPPEAALVVTMHRV